MVLCRSFPRYWLSSQSRKLYVKDRRVQRINRMEESWTEKSFDEDTGDVRVYAYLSEIPKTGMSLHFREKILPTIIRNYLLYMDYSEGKLGIGAVEDVSAHLRISPSTVRSIYSKLEKLNQGYEEERDNI